MKIKTQILALFIAISAFACNVENATVQPSLSPLDGKWKLTKIAITFRPPNSLAEVPVKEEEIIEINTSTKVFTRTKAGKLTESTSFEIKQVSYARDVFVFSKSNTYAFYTFDTATSTLIFDENMPVGTEIADGNRFHYTKIK